MSLDPATPQTQDFRCSLRYGSLGVMEKADGMSTELILEELARVPGQIEPLERALKHFRARQREYVIALVVRTELPLAEISRVAGLHRLTVSRWVREHNEATNRKSES